MTAPSFIPSSAKAIIISRNRPWLHAETGSREVRGIRERTTCGLHRLPKSLRQCLEKGAMESNETLQISREDNKNIR